MSLEITLLVTGVSFIAAYMVIPALAGVYRKFRGTMVVTCPETGKRAAVAVDLKHAALTSIVGSPDLRLASCSRWPDREGCPQDCLLQIELCPQLCAVRSLLSEWYGNQACVLCGKPFEGINALDRKPALMTPAGKSIEWSDIKSEMLPDVLLTHRPVCWSCHIAETFRSHYPDLVVERPFKQPGHVAKR